MTNITNNDYDLLIKKATPPSKSVKTVSQAFLIGGAICVLGEAFIQLYAYLGLDRDTSTAAASITLVFIAALLTGLNVYDNIAKYGGAGTLVPITGFANAIASPALEFKTEGYILGLGAKLFAIAGPVIVYGLASGIIYGLTIYIFKLY